MLGKDTLARMREGTATPDDLERVVTTTQHAIEEARRIYMDLRPSTLDDLGLIDTIDWFLRQFEDTYKGILVERHVELQEKDIPKALKMILFRVMQEAFHNMAMHSQAKRATLSLRKEESRISLVVSDSGVGFALDLSTNEPERRGLGLDSMQERVESSSGVLSIRSARGMGTTIQAVWDLDRL